MYIINVNSQNKSFFDDHSRIYITIEIPEKVKKRNLAEFSSKGPTIYRNRKPDIMAPGAYISSASSRKNTNKCNEKLSLLEMSGTSMATPAISCSVALIYDETKKITSALLRAFAISGSGDKADIEQGYGSLNLSMTLVYPSLDFDFRIRYYSDRINHNDFLSFFVKTDHIGALSIAIA